MRRLSEFVSTVVMSFALVVICLGCISCNKERVLEADIVQIRKFLATAGEAVNRGDVEAEVNRFTEDGIYMWPDAPAIEGHDSLRDWFELRFARFETHIESKTEELVVFGNWAFERGTSVARIRQKNGNHIDTVRGKYINLLQRQPDGSWKIARRIRNDRKAVREREA
jgi:ketosteroid isomerase-like protein